MTSENEKSIEWLSSATKKRMKISHEKKTFGFFSNNHSVMRAVFCDASKNSFFFFSHDDENNDGDSCQLGYDTLRWLIWCLIIVISIIIKLVVDRKRMRGEQKRTTRDGFQWWSCWRRCCWLESLTSNSVSLLITHHHKQQEWFSSWPHLTFFCCPSCHIKGSVSYWMSHITIYRILIVNIIRSIIRSIIRIIWEKLKSKDIKRNPSCVVRIAIQNHISLLRDNQTSTTTVCRWC